MNLKHLNAYSLYKIEDIKNIKDQWMLSPTPTPQFLLEQGFSNLPSYLAARVCGWIADGADYNVLKSIIATLPLGTRPGMIEWVQAFRSKADELWEKAEVAEKQENSDQACKFFLEAALYYYIGRWPQVLSKEAQGTYMLSVKAYERASVYFACPFQTINIPYEEHLLTAHLYFPYKPQQEETFPVVIVSGGMDTWKFDIEVQPIIACFLAMRVAVCAIDIPGTGQNPIPLSSKSEHMFNPIIEFLEKNSVLQNDAIGYYGLSFGGHWAVKLALCHPKIKAAVNVGGPLHLTFQKEWAQNFEKGTIATLAKCMGINLAEKGIDYFFCQLESLSLVKQGHLQNPKSNISLLSINGAKDELVPIQEITALSELGVAQDTFIYAQDRHVASYHKKEHVPFAAQWLLRKLKANGD